MSNAGSSGARTRARELMVQALYQKQLAGHSCAELIEQFHLQAAYQRVDKDFFDTVFPAICNSQDSLEQQVSLLIDRPLEHLDPIERSVLLIGVYELESLAEIPYRVVINESVNLAKRFASVDGHKYINACLDRAAHTLRSAEVRTQD